ncbi:hypothetical protein HN935_02880 [archaeon]|jgi:hypothetical protein|nr:hypothetical protein [Candidatus Jacksonbacteria bacterium]MBT7102433.1 hypothetical protein [archaeon]
MLISTNTVSVGIKLFCTEGTIDKINEEIRSKIHRVEEVDGLIQITFSFYKDALAVRRLIDKMTGELEREEALVVKRLIGKMSNEFAFHSLMSEAA